jgi:hypothetical protein
MRLLREQRESLLGNIFCGVAVAQSPQGRGINEMNVALNERGKRCLRVRAQKFVDQFAVVHGASELLLPPSRKADIENSQFAA